MKFAITTITLLISLSLSAQDYSINGKVLDEDNHPIVAATVSVLSSKDSSWLKTELTDEYGAFKVKNIKAGKYILHVNSVGYEAGRTALSIVDNAADVNIVLTRKDNQLAGVTVRERTDFIKTELGKTIVDVGKSEKVGINILELLGKLPGVSVSPNGDVSIDGKQGVVLLVDNKPTYMNGEELVAYLRGLSAEEVKQVEIMTQPSAKYDAEGNVGVINLEMNKNKIKGWSSSTNGRYSQGVYPFSSLSSTINFHKDKWHLYAQPGYWGGSSFLEKEQIRIGLVEHTNEQVSKVDESIYMRETFHDYNLKLGADYDLSDKTTIGAFVKGVYHPNNETDRTVSAINNDNIQIINEAINDNGFLRQHAYANSYITHDFSKKSSIDFSADYFGTWKDIYQQLDSRNYDKAGNAIASPVIFDNKMPVASHVYTAKLDYKGLLGKKTIEAGAKTSYVTIDEKNVFNSYDGQSWRYDTVRSNHFLYNESISAAYLDASWDWDKWQMQIGARGELSFVSGHELFQDKKFSRNRFNLFPTVFVSYKVDSNNSIECNYGRRIKRPFYRELNPFTRFVSQYNYAVGNPLLQPEYSDNIQLKHSYKNKLITTLGFARNTNVFTRVFTLDKQTNISNYSTTNNANRTTVDLSMYLRLPIVKEWLLTCTGGGYYTAFNGKIGSQMVDSSAWGYTVKIDSQFYFKKGWYASVNAQYMGPNITPFGHVDSFLFTNASLSKKVLDDAGTLKLNLSDPFGLYTINTYAQIEQTISNDKTRFNTQNVALSFSYNIGKKTKKDRNTEMAEEIQRM
ncbi:MAG: outer membrane beta-barrel family protein [Flavipsychrobacter sp.]